MAKSSSRWNIGRFIATLSFFGAIPFISQINSMVFGSSPTVTPKAEGNILFDFKKNSELSQLWGSLDDVVMGGVSQSQAKSHPEGLEFSGFVSTDNSGGFASIRTRNFEPNLNLNGRKGIRLTLKGDGLRYKFFMRDSQKWDSVAYAMSFDTKAGEWSQVDIPFSEMQPVMRAKIVPSAPDVDLENVASFQLMLSKFEYDGILNPQFKAGDFSLIVSSIELI